MLYAIGCAMCLPYAFQLIFHKNPNSRVDISRCDIGPNKLFGMENGMCIEVILTANELM